MTTTKKTPKNRPVIDWNRQPLLDLNGPWHVFTPGEKLPVPCDPCYFVRESIKRHIELEEAQQGA